MPSGRFLPALLVAAIAAFLLVPAALAQAAPTLTVEVEGPGEGEVSSVGGLEESGLFVGTPPIECSTPAPGSGVCTNEMEELEAEPGAFAVALHAVPDPGSKLVSWEVEEADEVFFCEPGEEICAPKSFGGDVIVIAKFDTAGFPLEVLKGGNGEGTVTSDPAGIDCGLDCEETFAEGEEVELEATAATGSEFSGWTEVSGNPGTCTGTTSPCEITISEAKEIEASFTLETRELTINESGPGTVSVQCEEGSGFEACAEPLTELPYGTEVKVSANPNVGAELESIGGTSSASGCVASPCTFTITEDSSVTVAFALESEPFSVSEPGSGTGTVECEDSTEGGGFGACAATYPFGHTIKVSASPDAGSELSALTGSGAAAGNCTLGTESCEFTIDEAASVTAVFDLIEFELSVTKSGEGAGTVTSTPSGINCGTECDASFPEGEEVELEANAGPGSEFIEWSGACSGSGACEVTMSEAQSVDAKFDLEAGASTLAVYKGGNGQGTITSDPAGINCGTEPCEAIFAEDEVVELEALAAPGSVFAGWIGCKHLTANTCTVKVKGATEVTAVFLADGAPGQGVTVTPEPAGANCANGGVKVVAESGTTYVCNGAAGANGAPGQGVTVTPEPLGFNCPAGGIKVVSESGTSYVCKGANGTKGPQGDTGAQGPGGQNGAAGAAGKDGAQGPQGPAGAQGPPGKVTCRVKQKGKKVKVTCTVKTKASSSRLRWRLMRAGRSYSHGNVKHGRLKLDLSHLRPGSYVLHVQGQKGGTRIVVE
jgi:hypothetical protein